MWAFIKMPASGADEEDGGIVDQFVTLAWSLGSSKVMVRRMASLEVDLAVEQVVPGGRGGVLEVGHEDLRAAVEGVDDHLAVDGAGDLDAAVEEVLRERGDLPYGFADGGGFGEEVGLFAGVEAGLAGDAGCKELFAARVEGAVQLDDEGRALRG